MTAYLVMDTNGLQITIANVEESDRSRVARMEVDVLKIYAGHRALPWMPNRGGKGYMLVWLCARATEEHMKQILKVFDNYKVAAWVKHKPGS